MAVSAINSTITTPSFFSHPVVRTVSADIVAGQIIATVIVIAFVAIFLLREWISQNARPGIFDDADPVPGQDDPVPAVPPAPPANVVPHPPALRLRDAINPAPVPLPPDYPNGHPLDVPNGKNRGEPLHAYRFNSDKDTQLVETDDGENHPNLRRRHSWNGLEGTRLDHGQPTYISPEEFVRREKAAMRARSSGSGTLTSFSNTSNNDVLIAVELGVSSSLPSEKALQKAPNRPPLFSTALLPPDSAASLSRFNEGIGASPPASPSLATYRAPEELEAGPSHSSDYFQQDDDDDDIEYDEYNLYFHKPEDSRLAAQGEEHDEPVQHADNVQIPALNPRAEHEEDHAMPELEQWTDEEFDEPEEDDNPIVEFGGAMDEEDREEVVDLLDRVPDAEEMAALEDDEIEAGIEDDMEGALEGRS